jgi:hypothetical protein
LNILWENRYRKLLPNKRSELAVRLSVVERTQLNSALEHAPPFPKPGPGLKRFRDDRRIAYPVVFALDGSDEIRFRSGWKFAAGAIPPDQTLRWLSFCGRKGCLYGTTTIRAGIRSTHQVACGIHHTNRMERTDAWIRLSNGQIKIIRRNGTGYLPTATTG